MSDGLLCHLLSLSCPLQGVIPPCSLLVSSGPLGQEAWHTLGKQKPLCCFVPGSPKPTLSLCLPVKVLPCGECRTNI